MVYLDDESNCTVALCILTYDRPLALRRTLVQASALKDLVAVYIFDDCPRSPVTEDIYKDLGLECSLINNETNMGYARNFCKVFDALDADFLIVLADDDQLVISGFHSVLCSVSHSAHRNDSAFYCTSFYSKESKKIRPASLSNCIDLGNFLDFSRHAPGLIYKRVVAKRYLSEVTRLIAEKNEFAVTYPQAVLLFLMLCNGEKCEILSDALVRQGLDFKSRITDTNGHWYGEFESRLLQFYGLLEIVRSNLELDKKNSELAQTHVKRYYLRQLIMQLPFSARYPLIVSLFLSSFRSLLVRFFKSFFRW